MKRLFGMSSNQCAMPNCTSQLIIGDVVVGTICHIQARRKLGPRYSPALSQAARDDFGNLILLCSTCHKLVDSAPEQYTTEWLQRAKQLHEKRAPYPIDLSVADARSAMQILAMHLAKTKRPKRVTGAASNIGSVHASATRGSVSVAIGGVNQAPINIKIPANRSNSQPYPANSIGADANMANYVEYLCQLYVDYMVPIQANKSASWAKLGKLIKNKFRLRRRSRGHLSTERFSELVRFLVEEKLARTPVGAKHLRQGTRLCRTFDEFRHGKM